MEIRALKRSAKQSLKGNWGIAIVMVIIFLICGALNNTRYIFADLVVFNGLRGTLTGNFITFLITSPVTVGISWTYLDIYDKKDVELSQIFAGFKNYLRVVGATFMVSLFIVLWMLLFIVPGIIKALSYSQTLYLIKENPDMGILEAITESRRMMNGYKGKLFLTRLSFLGWIIAPIVAIMVGVALTVNGDPLVALTMALVLIGLATIYLLGIMFYLIPYWSATNAGFYRELKNSEVEAVTEWD